jgi:DNA helicase-2/ATP-dependent DNA helicase PcrA
LSDEQGAVRLMTIHTAKGLEFPVVILVGCEEDLLPHASSLGDGAGEEEERRLFYVALTRARRRVYLLHALRRRRYGAYENASPSRFLAEIPEEHAERRREGLATAAGGARLWSGPATGRPALGGPPSRPSRDPQARDADKVASIWGHDLSQDEIRFHVGQTVLHASFGRGVVARVEGGGLDLTVSVDFPGSERKHFLARLAHLRPVD